MFRKILIANRGEIACRVIKTAKKMGINTVAIYSNIDSNAKHVQMADTGFYVGENKSSESYLKMERIIEIAKTSGAEAIHPGYGFLSENCHFVELCEKNNIKFIGPPSSAIKAMGSKIESKKIMENASVPIVPGYFGDNQDKAYLLDRANRIGYPIMIKADLGGGGKGMRIVRNEKEFEEALASAQAEAIKSFGSAKILMEKYLESSRHIEVQVFGDHQGNYVHLYERDCTIQRRHQKVVEEAPSYLEESLRSQLCSSAVQAAKAVGYTNAGTVEFIYDIPSKQFYFMEMNTRLQVEHPISEMITGQDFVEWQLIVASGGKLPLKQEEIKKEGHAIECRIYSEDPSNNFLPGSGKIHYIHEPSHRDDENGNFDENVRIETGIRKGDEVSIFYDPMIAKLVVYSKNRDLCIKKTIGCLENYQILGLPTNIKFLQSILKHETFKKWDFDTNFISKNFTDLMSFCEQRVKAEDVLSTVLCKILNEKNLYKQRSQGLTNPWTIVDNFRVNYTDDRIFNLVAEEQKFEVKLKYLSENSYQVVISGLDKSMDIIYDEVTVRSLGEFEVQINIKNNLIFKAKFFVDEIGNIRVLKSDGTVSHIDFALDDYGITEDHHESTHSNVKSPMPSTISKIFVKVGDQVDKGDKLISLEAMKMEHLIKAPKRTTIKAIYAKEAKFIEAGTVLIEFND